MQIAIKIEGVVEPVFIEVPDGLTPPSIGDSFHIAVPIVGSADERLVNYQGYYTVSDRQFLLEIKNQNGKCTFGWGLTLQRKPIS